MNKDLNKLLMKNNSGPDQRIASTTFGAVGPFVAVGT